MDDRTKELRIIRIQGEITDLKEQFNKMKSRQRRDVDFLVKGIGLLGFFGVFVFFSSSSGNKNISSIFLSPSISDLLFFFSIIAYVALFFVVILNRKKIRRMDERIKKRYAYIKKLKSSMVIS